MKFIGRINPNQQEKNTLEDTRRQPCEAGPTWQPVLGARLVGPTNQSPTSMSVHYRPMEEIYTVDLSQFDPRAHVHPTGLYKQPQTLG